MNGINIFGFFAGTMCLFGIIALIIVGVYVNYQYESQIGAYFDNAEDCITPECILTQLNRGYESINNSGLTKEDYGAWIFKKPNNKMEFQYQHLDAIIDRAEAVQNWVEIVYSNSSAGETMKDVYTEKMDNLRKYITGEGYRSDLIAKNSWRLKYHFFVAYVAFPLGVLLVISMFIFYAMIGAD